MELDEDMELEENLQDCQICGGELVYDGFEDTWGCCNCGKVLKNLNGPIYK